MSKAYIYVYQTICNKNGKTYIGVHATNNLSDGYIGNGVFKQSNAKSERPFHNAVRKYGYASFTRHILSFYDTYEEALDEEKYLVDKKWINLKNNYNCAIGGRGSTLDWMSVNQKRKHYQKTSGKKNHNFGKKAHNIKKVLKYDLNNNFINEYDSITDAAKSINQNPTNVCKCCIGKYGQCGGFIFRYNSYSEKEKKQLELNLNQRHRIYNVDGKFKMSDKVKEKLSLVLKGKKHPHSEETKKKLSLAKIGKKRKPHSEETKRKIGLANSKCKKEVTIECK